MIQVAEMAGGGPGEPPMRGRMWPWPVSASPNLTVISGVCLPVVARHGEAAA
jgi:hypothetical protein